MQENEIISHLSGIFDLNLASRIGAVIFSTGKGPVYEFSRAEVKNACSARNIPFIEMPYFATQGLSNPVLDKAIEDKDATIIRTIVSKFKASVQQPEAQACLLKKGEQPTDFSIGDGNPLAEPGDLLEKKGGNSQRLTQR